MPRVPFGRRSTKASLAACRSSRSSAGSYPTGTQARTARTFPCAAAEDPRAAPPRARRTAGEPARVRPCGSGVRPPFAVDLFCDRARRPVAGACRQSVEPARKDRHRGTVCPVRVHRRRVVWRGRGIGAADARGVTATTTTSRATAAPSRATAAAPAVASSATPRRSARKRCARTPGQAPSR
jgi:hypothetical protein